MHLPSLTWKQWRGRLAYAAMSLLVVWHTLAMIVAPSPDSVITRSVGALFEPYLTLFLLESTWSFYAPWALVRRSCCTIVWQLPTF